jgi:hypothetical protein
MVTTRHVARDRRIPNLPPPPLSPPHLPSYLFRLFTFSPTF